VQDIGSGIKTVLAQILSEQFGVAPAKISVKVGDTNYPVGPNSGGSVTTASLSPAVRDAAWQAAQKFLASVAPALHATPLISPSPAAWCEAPPTNSSPSPSASRLER